AEARAWLAGLPRTGGGLLERWDLRPDGPTAYGMASIVLPVRRADGPPAAPQPQRPRGETPAAAIGLRTGRGGGLGRLLGSDEESGGRLRERLDASRPRSAVAADGAAVQILAELLARLTSVPAPAGLRSLSG